MSARAFRGHAFHWFRQEPSAGELERLFRLDQAALEQAGEPRSPATKPGWAVQWGTMRMLGCF